ncbi:MAG: alanine dehydrogenase, partial [Bdellovibrionales bacterium]|nr:alanine dehydrogenase [Bdellovibrionales bacterium]
VTFKYASIIAKMGLEEAVQAYPLLEKGVNVYGGKVTYEAVAKDLGMEYVPYKQMI